MLCGTGANYRTHYHTPCCLPGVWRRKIATASIPPVIITPSKTRSEPPLSPPMLSHPYRIPPGVVNNLKSQTTTHFITGGTVYTTPPRYTTPGDKIPKPKILSQGVWCTMSYTGTVLTRRHTTTDHRRERGGSERELAYGADAGR